MNNNKEQMNNNNKDKDNNKDNNNNDKDIILKISIKNVDNSKRMLYSFIEVKSLKFYRENKDLVKRRAVQLLCNKLGKTGQELIDEGYTQIKVEVMRTRKE